jgi:hypothetical protein
MTYPAPQTCTIITDAKGRRRVHEQGPDGKALCAAHNAAAANNSYRPLGPGTVNCLRCARAAMS